MSEFLSIIQVTAGFSPRCRSDTGSSSAAEWVRVHLATVWIGLQGNEWLSLLLKDGLRGINILCGSFASLLSSEAQRKVFFRMIRHPLFQTRGFSFSTLVADVRSYNANMCSCVLFECVNTLLSDTHTHTHTQETWTGPGELTDPDSKCQSSPKLKISYQYFC